MLSCLVVPLTLILEIQIHDTDFEDLDFIDDTALIASSIKGKRQNQSHIKPSPPKYFSI